VATYKVYDIEPMGMASTPLLVTAVYTNSGGHFKGEFFLAVPDDPPFFQSQGLRFNEKTFRAGGAALDETFMLKLVYQRAMLVLRSFVRDAARKNGAALYPRRPEVLESDRESLLGYWMTGSCPDHLVEINRRTKCDELKEYIEWVLMLPEVEKQDL